MLNCCTKQSYILFQGRQHIKAKVCIAEADMQNTII